MSETFDSSTPKKRRVGQRMTDKQREETQQAFLKAYEKIANVLVAAEQVGIDRTLVYYWQEHDDQFALAFNMADKAANMNIEAEIHRRAIEGVEKPLASAGRVVYDEYEDEQGKKHKDRVMIREYSDTLLIFYAKRRMPEYREKTQVDVNANVSHQGSELANELRLLSDEQYAQFKSWVLSAKEKQG